MLDRRRPDPQQGVFETLLLVDGRPVELHAHLTRLETSLAELYPGHAPPPLDVPVVDPPQGWSTTGTSRLDSLRITVAPSGGEELKARIATKEVERQTRTVSLHSFPLIGGLGAHKWADRSLLEDAEADLADDVLALIVDRDGTVLEASRANVFAVKEGALLTPPTDGRILPGVTRMRVLKLAESTGLETRETGLSGDDLIAADEVFLSGSVRGVERVEAVDGRALSGDGEITTALAAELHRAWLGAKVG